MSKQTQPQNEALVRLLIAAKYQDKKLSLLEDAEFHKHLERLPWDSGTALSLFVMNETATIREALSSEDSKQKFLAGQCAQFTDSGTKSNALNAIAIVLQADGIDPKESAFLLQLKTILHT